MAVRNLNNTLRDSLLKNESFVYAHLIKFEKPLATEDGKSRRRAKDYVYLSDGSRDLVFDDGSSDVEGNSNGFQTYIANKVTQVGSVTETVEARASSMNIQMSLASLSTKLESVSTDFTGTTFTIDDDLVEQGFREGDIVEFTYVGGSPSHGNSTVRARIESFTAANGIDNATANCTVLRTSTQEVTAFSTGTNELYDIELVNPELQSIFEGREGTSYARYINRDVSVYKVHLDQETGAFIGEPYLLFKGIIASAKATEDVNNKSVISWTVTSHWGDFVQVSGRLTSDESHRALNAAGIPDPESTIRPEYVRDLGFTHSEQAINLVAIYQAQETRVKVKYKKGFLGIGAKVKTKEYQVEVDREVDLRFNLDAKYLPVVYGVNKIDSIPIFVDTLSNDPKKVYVAYALCEGQIGGLYDIYFDDTSSICLDANDFDTRSSQTTENTIDVLCTGRMDRGDTLTANNVGTGSFTTAYGNPYVTGGPGGSGWRRLSDEIYYGQERIEELNSNFGSGTTVSSAGITHEKGTSFSTPIDTRLIFHAGLPNQKADGLLIANSGNFKVQSDYFSGDASEYWGANHKLLDTAYVVAEYTLSEGETSIPSLDFIVRGRGIPCYNYDYSYEQNPAFTGTDAAFTAFNLGQSVTLKKTSDDSTIGTATIADMYTETTVAGLSQKRIRFTADPSLSSVTDFYIESGVDKFHLQQYNNLVTSGTVQSVLKEDIVSAASTTVTSGTGVDVDITGASQAVLDAINAAVYATINPDVEEGYNFDWLNIEDADGSTTIENVGATDQNVADLETQTIAVLDAIHISNSHSNTDGAYNNYTIRLTRVNDDNSVLVQTRKITGYIGATGVVSVDRPWDGGVLPQTTDTYEIYSSPSFPSDERVTTNPAMQVLDYLTSDRYGRGLDLETDIDLEAFKEAARACDTRSNVKVLSSTLLGSANTGSIYKYESNGQVFFQGTAKSESTAVFTNIGNRWRQSGSTFSGTQIEFEDVLGKLGTKWQSWKSFELGELFWHEGSLYAKTGSAGAVTEGSISGLTPLTSITLTRVSGAGPATLTIDADIPNFDGNPLIKDYNSANKTIVSGYTLYDADDVKYWRYLGWEQQNQRWATRHQTNAVINTNVPVFDNINNMLGQFNGILRYSNGKYGLAIKGASVAATSVTIGAETYQVETIEEADIVGSISVEDAGNKGTFNQVTVSIDDPQNRFEGRSITLFDSNYLKQDRKVPKKGNVKSPNITNYYNARLNAKQFLEDSRYSLKINFTMAPRGVLLLAGDLIRINYDRFGWSNKLFRIQSLNFNTNCLVQVTAEEHNDSAYLIEQVAPQVIRPSEAPTAAPEAPAAPTALSASTAEKGGITLNWTNDSKFNAARYSVQIWRSSDNDRANATLIGTSKSDTYTDQITSIGKQTRYYWVRYAVLKPNQNSTTVADREVFSVYAPSGATSGVEGVCDGSIDGITINLSNDNVTLPVVNGTPDFTGSGTVISAFIGTTQLSYDESSPYAEPSFRVSNVSTTGVTIDSTPTNTATTYELDDITALPGDTGSATYTIVIRDSLGAEISFDRTQTFSKGSEGERGPGRWNVPVTSLPTTSSEAETAWNTSWTNRPGDPVLDDQAWFFTGTETNQTGQTVWLYSSDAPLWVNQTELIDGDFLLNNSINSSEIASNAVGSEIIASNAVTSGGIAQNAVLTNAVASNAILTNAVASNAILTNAVASNAILTNSVASNAILTNALASNSVLTNVLASNSVITNTIAVNSVITDTIAANSIIADTIAANEITADLIAANSINANKIAANSITADTIAANQITAELIAANSINANKIAANSITADAIAANQITADLIAANAISAGEISANSINANSIAAGSVSADSMQANSITASSIAACSITAEEIAANAINVNELAANSITANSLQTNAVTTEILSANSVTANTIAANQITATQIAANQITADLIAANQITADLIAANSITATAITANQITADLIAANSITASAIAACSITAEEIAANSIDVNELAANSITTRSLQTDSVKADSIAANQITADLIAANSINTNELAANSINANAIKANAITADAIGANQISANLIAANAISTDELAANSITTRSLQANSVSTAVLAANSVKADNIRANSIGATEILAQSIGTNELQADSVTADILDAGSVTADAIAAGAVTANAIAANQITANAIATNSITAENIQAGSIDTEELAAGAITADEISAGAVTATAIQANAVVATTLKANSVTARSIAANAVGADEIAANSITANEIAAQSITSNTIQANAINADQIAANSITANEIQANTIDAELIRASAIIAEKIAANAINANKIAANAVTANEIAANSVAADEIVANSITADLIAANQITADLIAANSIQANEISANSINANAIAANSITSDMVTANSVVATLIDATSVTATDISVQELSSIAANIGAITAGTLQGGSIPDANASPTGSEQGAFLDLTQGKMVFGNNTKHILFDGTDLILSGVTIDASSIVDATSKMKVQDSGGSPTDVDDLDFGTNLDVTFATNTNTSVVVATIDSLSDSEIQALITEGTGIDVTSGTVSLDFSTLTDMTADITSGTEFILLNGATESRKAASEIKLSALNNDANFSTTTGTVTSVGGTGTVNGITLTGSVSTSGNLTLGGSLSDITFSQLDAGSIQTSTELTSPGFANNDTSLLTAAAVDDLILSKNYSTTTGTVTSVGLTAGNLIDISGGPVTSSGSITVNVDLSELADSTAALISTDELVVLDSSVQGRKAINEIGLQLFDNSTSGFTTNSGTVTSVGGTGSVNGITLTGSVSSSGNLTLGGTLGSITVSQLDGASLQTSGESFVDNDTTLMTSAAINDRIQAISSNNSGTVTSVGGTGSVNGITLTGSVSTSGNLTLGGTLGSINFSQLDGSAIQTSGESFVDNDTTLMTSAAIDDLIVSKSYSTTTGTVTSVGLTAGNLIDISGGPVTSSGSITVNVDLSELADSTAALVNTDELVVLDNSIQGRKALNEIGLQLFDNSTTGFTDNPGTVTSIGGTGTVNGITLSGTVTGSGNLSLGGTLGNITFSQLDGATVQTSGEGFTDVDNALMTAANINDLIESKNYTDNTGTVTSVGSGTGLSGGPITGSGSLSVDFAEVVRTSTDQTVNGNKTFGNNVIVSGNLTVSGSTTTINTQQLNVADNVITVNSDYTGSTPTEDGGIEVERGTQTNKNLLWKETNVGEPGNLAAGWTFGSERVQAGTFYGNFVGDVTGSPTDLTGLSTDDLSEGSTNLYFTNARAQAAITAGDGLSKSVGTLSVNTGDGLTTSSDNVTVDSTVLRTTGNQSISGIKTFNDTLALNDPDSLSFEAGKHWFTYNDAQGNFNIRMSHKSNASSVEECTENGYIAHWEYGNSSGNWDFQVSSASLLVGELIGTDADWWTQLRISPTVVNLGYQGSTKLSTASTGISVTGNIAVTGTVDGVDIASLGSTVSGLDVPAITSDGSTPSLNSGITDAEIRALINVEPGVDVQAYNATLATVANSTYAGDNNIDTLGTIATGTWQATDVAVAHGGTGASDAATARTNLGLAIGTNVQAYNATLATVANSTYAGDNNITTVGTIGTGTWQGTVIASAYLDADTAHLSGTQTFTGQKNFNTSTNAIPLNISRNGSGASQVLSIGITDTSAIFNYIEDTSSEGTGAYGSYLFQVSGNEGTSPTITALALDENQAKLAGTVYTRGATSLVPDATQPGAIILANGGSEASPSTDGRGIEFLTADANNGYGHRIVSFDNTSGDTPLLLQRRNNNAAWTTQITFEGNSNDATFAGSISASNLSGNNTGDEPNASASVAGIVTTGTQTFAGNKTFNGSVTLNNTSLSGVHALSFNDPGPAEGISWSGGNFSIYESPNDLTTNTAGNLQFVSGGVRRVTFDTSGNADVTGSISASNLSGTNTGDEPNASTTVKGIVELATTAETTTGTDATRAVTPDGLKDGYQGSTNVTTLGTITTGTWTATDVAVAHGGTGASDASTARTNLGLAIGTNVQAYNATLASVAAGTYTGDDSITTVGTIATGVWNGSVIASAYLDSDTAHLSGSQTFTGTKTFSSNIRTSRIDTNNGQQLVINAGESASYATGQTSENVFVNAEGGLVVVSSPDNWDNANAGANAWANRQTATINGTSGQSTFPGNVTITGALNATTKSFLIEHPTKEGKMLRHGSLEGPENGVYVRGKLSIEETIVELPEYWTALVDEDTITVNLTTIGRGEAWVEKIEDNKVVVGKTTECFYMILAERKDVEKLIVEE